MVDLGGSDDHRLVALEGEAFLQHKTGPTTKIPTVFEARFPQASLVTFPVNECAEQSKHADGPSATDDVAVGHVHSTCLVS